MGDKYEQPSAYRLKDDFNLDDWQELLKQTRFSRSTVSKLIMNFLVTEGFKEAAENFSKESGLPLCGTDISVSLDERIKIRDAIHDGRIFDAKNLVDKLYPQLLQNDRHLLFRVHQQHLIELIREKRIEEALEFGQKELGSIAEEDHSTLVELERTFALLAFDNPSKSPFGDLVHPSHRHKVASEVNAAILEMDGVESTTPSMAISFHMLLWAQEQLEKKKARFPKMTNIAEAVIEAPE